MDMCVLLACFLIFIPFACFVYCILPFHSAKNILTKPLLLWPHFEVYLSLFYILYLAFGMLL